MFESRRARGLFHNPVVVGGGTRFLPPIAENLRLNLIEARTFGSRVIYERYRRVRSVTTAVAMSRTDSCRR
ncbi:MAG: hypothetical protein ACYCSI_09345 [Solirubrobacteraceae bacterium]